MERGINFLLFFLFTISGFSQNTLYDIVSTNSELSTLQTVLQASDSDEMLKDTDASYTLFAPTNLAFDKLDTELLNNYINDPKAKLLDILLYHVADSLLMAKQLRKGDMHATLNGNEIKIDVSFPGIFSVNDVRIRYYNIVGSNGVIHLIDDILMPPFESYPATVIDIIEDSDEHGFLNSALDVADLKNTFKAKGPFTIFAPTNEAFFAMPNDFINNLLSDPNGALKQVLLNHTLDSRMRSVDFENEQILVSQAGEDIEITIEDGEIYVNDAKITVSDLRAENGVVHVIDVVLLPPKPKASSIMKIIETSPEHSFLESALIVSDLEEMLRDPGDYTLFAPTNLAFFALPGDFIDALLSDPRGKLAEVLLYHTIDERIYSDEFVDGESLTTMMGKDLQLKIQNNSIYINGIPISTRDLEAENGIVHVIDVVLVPTDDLSESEDVNLVVYPNPATHTVSLQNQFGKSNAGNVRIFNKSGDLLLQQYIQAHEAISVEHLEADTYYLEYRNDTQYRAVLQFVKQ